MALLEKLALPEIAELAIQFLERMLPLSMPFYCSHCRGPQCEQ